MPSRPRWVTTSSLNPPPILWKYTSRNSRAKRLHCSCLLGPCPTRLLYGPISSSLHIPYCVTTGPTSTSVFQLPCLLIVFTPDRYEAGGAAFHSGAHTVAVIPSNRHHLTLSEVEQFVIQGPDVHVYESMNHGHRLAVLIARCSSPTHVITLENTLNGTTFPQEEIIKISEFARKEGVKMHLDGARLWHVAAETGTPMKELCDPFDSVSLCFSKGLGKCDGHLRGRTVHKAL